MKIFEDKLAVDEAQSRRSTKGNEPITTTMVVAIGLRFMGGESAKSLADIFGMHIKSAERAIDRFLMAVDGCDHIDLSIGLLPKTDMDMKRMAHEWNSRSSASHAFFGVLSAIDGWLCTTEKPSDVSNPSDYFSGHYQRFGYNVQAACDANLRFIYFTVAGPGKTNDANVF